MLLVPEILTSQQILLQPFAQQKLIVHRWYVARFEGNQPVGVESFEEFLEATRLGRDPLPNSGEEVDEELLGRLLPKAIEAVERRVLTDRDRFRAEIGPKLNDELDRLARLQGAQLDFIDEFFEDKRDARAQHMRSQRERHVRNLFADYKEWIQNAMTIADTPFLQVVAVLVGGAR